MASKRKDGRWIERFTFNGKRFAAYGKTRKEAIENAEKKKTELQSKVYIKASEMTVNQYYEKWNESRKGVVKGATIRHQQFDFQRASKVELDSVGTTFGELKLTEVEPQHIRDLQKALINTFTDTGEAKYSTTSVNASINYIRHLFNSCVQDRIITFNPCIGVKDLKRTEAPARETTHRALTVEETKAFFEAAKDSYYYNVYRFMLYSGCRCGEVGALKASDISKKEGKIQIRRTLTKDETGRYIVGSDAKTSSGIRDIPLTTDLQEVIESQKDLNRLLSDNHVIKFDELLFTSPEGNLLSDTCVNRDITRRCKKAGIDKFTAHAFRDTFATRCIESGMNPKTLQVILGHADIGITMNLYCHVMDETKVTEMKKVNIVI